jgi:DNA-directed RNA polymerase specialized sigma24 family protein
MIVSFRMGCKLMSYGDQELIDHINRRLPPEEMAEIDDQILHSTIGGELHERYWKLQVWDAVRSQKSYAKHICGEHRSGSAEDDAHDLICIAFEKLSRHCEKAELNAVQFRDGAYEVSNGTGDPKKTNGIRPLQCRLQILELENAGKSPASFKIDGILAPIELGPAPSPAAKVAHRFFQACDHRITTEPSSSDRGQLSISVVPLKFILRKTLKNLSTDLYLKKLTPKESKRAEITDDGKKPRYASKSDGFESLNADTNSEGDKVSEDSLLSQQQVDEMHREVTGQLELRSEGSRVLQFIQSDEMNPDFREALLLFLNGASYLEISKNAGITEGNARKRVCKARIALAKAFPELHQSLKTRRARSGSSAGLGE